MTDDPQEPPSAILGTPPSQRPAVPEDPAEHAQDFARRYAVPLDQYCAIRMQELGIPEDKQGADDLRPHIQWCAFDPHGLEGGSITGGITVNSGDWSNGTGLKAAVVAVVSRSPDLDTCATEGLPLRWRRGPSGRPAVPEDGGVGRPAPNNPGHPGPRNSPVTSLQCPIRGVLNPELLKGQQGGRIWPKARLRDQIDATIAYEWAESTLVNHEAALKAAAKTELPVSDGAKRILKAMAR